MRVSIDLTSNVNQYPSTQYWDMHNIIISFITSSKIRLKSHFLREFCGNLDFGAISFIRKLWFYITRQIWGIWKLRPVYSPEMPNLGQNRWCFVPCDLEIWWMILKNNRHLSFAVSSFVQHFIAIGEFKLELQSGNTQFGSNLMIFRAVWPWNLTDDLQKQ